MQKCLDKDPSKRWSCDRLLTHAYFEDFAKRQKEVEASAAAAVAAAGGGEQDSRVKLTREKTKVSEFCALM